MGTNFYLVENPCDKCGRNNDKFHIGKSSVGWAFALRVYPHRQITSLNDWIYRFIRPDTRIEDEYGRLHTVEEMLHCIFRGSTPSPERNEIDRKFLAENGAELDCRGFLRMRGWDVERAYDMHDRDFS